MNLAIVGTGAMAKFYASTFRTLAPTLIGRQSGGPFILSDNGHTEILNPPFLPWQAAAGISWDVIILAVKWPAMPLVQSLMTHVPSGSLVISLMNGMGQEEALIPPLDPSQLAAGMTTDAVTGTWDESRGLPAFTVTAHGETMVPWLPHPSMPLWQNTVTDMGLSWRFLPQDSVLRHRWVKLVQNSLINPLSALANVPNGTLPDMPIWNLAPALLHEARTVARAAGIVLEPDLDAQVVRLARATARNISSMLQDVRKNRETEIDAINGYLLRCATQYGIEIPVHRALVQLIHALSSQAC